ncbi:MAG: hypothetical protein GX874_00655 [Smithella sp.]|nr:hypothetical protein [Smithella sp.]
MNATSMKKYPIKFSVREREIIQKETFYDPDFAKFAIVDGKAIRVDLSLDDIEDIQGYVAAAANHAMRWSGLFGQGTGFYKCEAAPG